MPADKTEFKTITYRKDLSNYEVNRLGQLRNIKTGLLLKGSICRDGYMVYMLRTDEGRKIQIRAHMIVANEYIPKIRGKHFVNHKDEDKTNCDIDNLEWCTAKENINHATCQERRAENRKRIVNEYDIDGHYIRTWLSGLDVTEYIAECLKMDIKGQDVVYSCCNRKTYIALGRIWRYYDGDTSDLVMTSDDLPTKICWRKDWNDFVNAADIPEKYLYNPLNIAEIEEYFMKNSKLSAQEKMMLKEVFSKIPAQ